MLNPKTNVGKLRNGVLVTLFAYFQNDLQKSWNLTYNEIFYFWTIFYPKSLVLCPKMFFP